MTAAAPPWQPKPPHPVYFGVEYDEHQDRWKTLLRIFLAIPQLLVAYVLQTLGGLLGFIAWFAILFTGRYPRGLFDLSVGIMRWSANVFAYASLLRDEYPPFSLEPGRYPLILDIPYPERQSRWRLFVRYFAIIPNYIVFSFVQFAWLFVTIFAWIALLIGAKYPRRVFGFSAGTMRWYLRQQAYLNLLSDKYPPYRMANTAPPGNEVISAIIGAPLFATYIAVIVLVSIPGVISGSDTVDVRLRLTSPFLEEQAPSGSAGGLRLTLIGYDDDAPVPRDVDDVYPGYRFIAFRIEAEKDGIFPAFFTPYVFNLRDCEGFDYLSPDAVTDGFEFHFFLRGGSEEGWVVFQIPDDSQPCRLAYQSIGRMRFVFWGGI